MSAWVTQGRTSAAWPGSAGSRSKWPRHREGPWQLIEDLSNKDKPRPPRRQVGKPPQTGLELPLLEVVTGALGA